MHRERHTSLGFVRSCAVFDWRDGDVPGCAFSLLALGQGVKIRLLSPCCTDCNQVHQPCRVGCTFSSPALFGGGKGKVWRNAGFGFCAEPAIQGTKTATAPHEAHHYSLRQSKVFSKSYNVPSYVQLYNGKFIEQIQVSLPLPITHSTRDFLENIDKVLILPISQVLPSIVVCCLLGLIFFGIRDGLNGLHRLVYDFGALSDGYSSLLVLLVQIEHICSVRPVLIN